ncbi:MAG: ornithine carbamoyltransferase [Spirochaetales bacterium]|jgi:ornithine carbamoyltransferase|nr:ornithine carbamoyltransferase [Spirochaetales bacterium]
MKDLKGTSITGITDINKEEIEMILDVSRQLKLELKTGKAHRLLEGKSLAGIFESPSTRTSISFETAMTQLGGHMLWLDENRLWVGEAAEEDWHDTIKTISRYVDGIAYRAMTRERLDSAKEYASIPIINASCPVEHPCQAMADALTMIEKKGPIQKKKVAFLWGYRAANPPAGLTNSTMLMAGKLGFDMTIACPEGFDPDGSIQAIAEKEAAHTGGSVKVVRSYEEAATDADFVNVYSWVSPEVFAKGLETHFQGDPEFIEMKGKLAADWCVDKRVVDMAKHDAMVMHCMPISRNTEVTDEVLSSDQSIIFDVAENRLHTEKAMLALLMGGYR